MPRSITSGLSAVLAVALTAGASVAIVAMSAGPAAAATTAHNPRVALDSLTRTGAVVSYRGWAVDPDMSGTVRIVVLLDTTVVRSTLANLSRPDVGRAHPSYGANRGFAGSLRLAAGPHRVCLMAGDLGSGSDTSLGCKGFTAPGSKGVAVVSRTATKRPVGRLDAFSYSPTTHKLSVRGWAFDPNSTGSIFVDTMISGQSMGSAIVNRPRADVAKLYPGRGANHGFAYTMRTPVSPGNYRICSVAINSAAGGNTILPCKVITLRPLGNPAALNVSTTATAAAAIRAQAVRSGAAPASRFPANANSATTIALATRALLQQAAGRSARPPARSGVPAFAAATPSRIVDEQAVMGSKPSMGSYPQVKKAGRAGSTHALQLFAHDSRPTPGGSGDGILGAAAVLAANGTTVHPSLPRYPPGYPRLRAEVAIDAALAHIGDPYVWAAAGPNTFDCSGLTQWAWAKAGVSIAHYTNTQAAQSVRLRTTQLLPGDLVLFGSNLHHVGMYLGAGYMLDAPDTGAYVRVDKISWFGDFSLAVRP